ncbi:3391_t:CDS:1 [Dentiscutata erythropus]|uniref:3391_t:CDS:1 n=1 Tax=Dentiscutata erythropus TaxID=1348616 RepID=A0A9N9BRH1_9GLOM|nr:3391_t:CDS:1 [Dentiscutata erythropus]
MKSQFTILLFVFLASAITLVSAQQNVTALFPEAEADNNICKGKTPTNGLQNRNGSCSDTVQGEIPDVDHMVSSLIVEPANGCNLPAFTNFTVKISTIGIVSGFFDDPTSQYYTFPQVVDKETGNIFGHSHVTIQQLNSTTLAPNPKLFAFFKGLNAPEEDGLFSQVVGSAANNGLPPGEYRICSMVASFAHQPTIMPVAQRGSQDDCIRITISDAKKKRKVSNKKRKA